MPRLRLSPGSRGSQRTEADSKSSEGVVIFTGMRVSASSLKCTTQPVRTRSSQLVIFVVAAGVALVPGLNSSAAAQVQAKPQFTADAAPQVLCPTQVVGNRRIPKESVLERLFSRPGDTFDPAVVQRDFNSLWNTGYFDDLRIERVAGDNCLQLIIYVREKPPSARSTTRASMRSPSRMCWSG